MKTLVIAYSFTGNNLTLARRIAEDMNGRIELVKEIRPRASISILWDLIFKRRGRVEALTARPADYDHVVFVAPVWDRHLATPMRAAMRNCAADLPSYSVASLCGLEREGQSEALLADAKEATGRAPAQLLELWVSDLLLGQEKPDGLATTNHRVTPDELAHFAPKIAEFLEAIEQAAQQSSQP